MRTSKFVSPGLRRVALAIFTVFVAVGAHEARADADHPEVGAATSAAGVSGGSGDVASHSGASTFAYSFELPPGRDGLTPSLSLSYSSNGGNSWVGRGFALGTSTIQRDTRNGVPAYDASDRFVVDGMPLIPQGDVAGLGREYRPARDPGDVQYIYAAAENLWRVRMRNGHELFYRAAVFRNPAPAMPLAQTLSNTFAWLLVKERDQHSNTIEYEYDRTHWPGYPGVESTAVVPRLSDIWYGGNEGDAARGLAPIPHMFHVVFARDGAPVPSSLETQPVTRPNCLVSHGAGTLDMRAGGRLDDPDGIYSLLRSVAVEVAWPGTTDGSRREYPWRRARYWQLSYNWDWAGCRDTTEWWPLLREIRSASLAENGAYTPEPTVTLGYYSWERTLAPVTFAMPETAQIDSIGVRDYTDFYGAMASHDYSAALAPVNRGLETTVTNEWTSLWRTGLLPAVVAGSE